MNEKMIKALRGILAYTNKKTPKTLAEAKAMLDVISVIASETLNAVADETKVAA